MQNRAVLCERCRAVLSLGISLVVISSQFLDAYRSPFVKSVPLRRDIVRGSRDLGLPPWVHGVPTITATKAEDIKMKHFRSFWCLWEYQVSDEVCLG